MCYLVRKPDSQTLQSNFIMTQSKIHYDRHTI